MEQNNPTIPPNEKLIERQRMEEEIENDAKILFQHQKNSKIDQFTGYYEFLHNNYLSPVLFEGMLFPSATHAFQAARSSDETTRKAILNAESLNIVLKIAKRIEEPENWSLKRLNMMEKIVRDKFRRSRELQEKLKATSSREIVMSYLEPSPSNLYWGQCNGKGQNQLGRLLMKIRNDIKQNQELLNWISIVFDFITDKDLLPEIKLDIFKEGKQIDCKILKNKSFYILGNLPSSDLVLEHLSISRIHAALVCDKNLGCVLIDLRSKAGTRLDGEMISDNIPYRLKNGKKIKFGMSTREYIVSFDIQKMEKLYYQEKKQLESELDLINQLQTKEINNDILKRSFGINNNDANSNIFISNIPYDATEKGLKEIFEDFGTVKNIKIPKDRASGESRGHAFIEFEDPDQAKLAVKTGIVAYTEDKSKRFLDFSENRARSRSLKIRFADPKPDWGEESKINNLTRPETRNDIEQRMRKDYEGRTKKKRQRSESSSSSSSSSESSSDSEDSESSEESIEKEKRRKKNHKERKSISEEKKEIKGKRTSKNK